MVVPQLVLAIIGGSLTHVLIPLLSIQRGEIFHKNSWGFFFIVGALFSTIAFIFFVTSQFWVPWTVPGFDASTKSLTISLVKIQLISIVFAALSTVLYSINYARQRFLWVEVSSIISNIVGFGLLMLGLSHFGIIAAAWVMTLRNLLQTLFLLGGLGSYIKPDWRSESFKDAWFRLKPLLFGNAYFKTEQLVDRFLASMTPPGGLTLLYIAQQLYDSGNVILNKALVTPMTPTLANKAHNGEWQSFRHIFFKRLFLMAGVTGLGFLVILIFGKPILAILFGFKHFGVENVIILWWLLIALFGVWIGGGMGAITSTTYYAKGDTRTPIVLGIWTYTLYIPIKILSFILFKLTGLAASTSLYYLTNLALQIYFLRKLPHEN
jgi:putative peptidoglycan lipid II flippase